MREQRLYRSGELVTKSGVYAVLHSTPHSMIQHVAHVEGTHFKQCKLCPLGVWYRLDAPGVRAIDDAWSYAVTV